MRITFVMPVGGISGGNRVVALYAERLVDRGHAVHVVWQKKPTPRRLWRRWRQSLGLGRGGKQRQGSLYFDNIGVTQSISADVGRVTAADVPDADAIVATWWETAFSVAELPKTKGRKFYFIQHHEVHDHLPSHISRATYYLPLRKITISRWLVDLMAEEYGDHDVALVENSVDIGQFDAPPRTKNTTPVVGLLYSWKKFKGVDVSLEAIRIAQKTVPDLRVVAFGTTRPGASLPLPEDATYFQNPAQNKIRDIYEMCDIWLCGSWQEGFHLPPLEAMACRTPVVSTRIGGAVDVITEGRNGWLADTGNAALLGQRLAEVATLSPEAWQEMSEAAYARARSYTWDDATDRFENFISEADTPPSHKSD